MKAAERLQDLFAETGALLRGHFLLSSGLHSDQYLQCALLLAHPRIAEELGAALARLCASKPGLVVSPALGGLIIGQEVARTLGARHYFCERENGVMTLRRGFSLEPGESVALVEDVVTTGKSSQEVAGVVSGRGAHVASWLSVVDRAGSSPSLGGVPLKSLLRVEAPAWRPDSCPLCKQGKPIVKPGSRARTP